MTRKDCVKLGNGQFKCPRCGGFVLDCDVYGLLSDESDDYNEVCESCYDDIIDDLREEWMSE